MALALGVVKYAGEKYTRNLAERIKNGIIQKSLEKEIRIVGPAEATISVINDVHRYMIYAKSDNILRLTGIKDAVESEELPKNIRVTFDFDPLTGY